MRKYSGLIMALILSAVFSSVYSQNQNDMLNETVRKIKQAQNFRYDFEQRSIVSNMEEKLDSEGFLIYQAPLKGQSFPRVYLEYPKPEDQQQLAVFDGQVLWTYRKANKQVTKQTLTLEELDNYSGIFIPQWLESLLKKSTVKLVDPQNSKGIKYLITPNKPEEEMFWKVELYIDPASGELINYSLVDNSNNKIEVKIKSVQYNITLNEQQFVFTPPPDAEITEALKN